MIGSDAEVDDLPGYVDDEDLGRSYDSENDSELEEIELALYSQIHYQQSSPSSPLREPSAGLQTSLSVVGPGGDNPYITCQKTVPSRIPGVNFETDDADSVCVLKTKSKRKELRCGDQSLTSVRQRGRKRRRDSEGSVCGDGSEGSLSESSGECVSEGPAEFVAQLSSDGEVVDEEEPALGDVQIHLNIDSGEKEDNTSETDDEQNWAILDQDRQKLPQLKYTATRYYRPGDIKPLNVRCRNCNEIGHLSKICPKPRKHLICYLCGETGHNFRSCPTSICYNCDSAVGHTAKQCPAPRKRHYGVCHRCEMLGHMQFTCPDQWRQYHLTTQEGKLKKSKRDRNRRVYCHNCGEKGHFGFECEEARVNAHSPAVYPFIARYQSQKPHLQPDNTKKGHRSLEKSAQPRKKQRVDDSSHTHSISAKSQLNTPGDQSSSNRGDKKAVRKRQQNSCIEADDNYVDKPVKQMEKSKGRKDKKQKKRKRKDKQLNKTKTEYGQLESVNKKSVLNVKPSKKGKNKTKVGNSQQNKNLVVQTNRGFNVVLPNLSHHRFKF